MSSLLEEKHQPFKEKRRRNAMSLKETKQIVKIGNEAEEIERKKIENEEKRENTYLAKVIIVTPGGPDEGVSLNELPGLKEKILKPEYMNLTNAAEEIDTLVNNLINPNSKYIKHHDNENKTIYYTAKNNPQERIEAHDVRVTGETKESKESKESKEPVKQKWTYCKKDCVNQLKPKIVKELNSTAYMLRLLSNSVIDMSEDKSKPLKFFYDPSNNDKLTKEWENDHKYFELKVLDENTQKGRLIMGFGPSASGKTYWAENAIKLLNSSISNFPNSFLSVDGGDVRKYSEIYQDIIIALRDHPVGGFTNLVKASKLDFLHTNLFSSSDVKKKIKSYLLLQSEKYTQRMNAQRANNNADIELMSPVSIYVPETASSSPLRVSAYKKAVSPFIKITNDNEWIGLYIWQGKTSNLDKKWVKKIKKKYSNKLGNENIEAKSTTVSGTTREEEEGKKYSSSAYRMSERNGLYAIKQAPGGRINIHNSGGKTTKKTFNKSVVIEYANKNNQHILNQEKLNSFNAIYIREAKVPVSLLSGGRMTRRLRKKSRNRKTKRKGRKKNRRKTKHKGRKRSRKR